ncbi:dTDP-4-dehydrorhamnose 3,5-epimerase [Proteiniborus ethanoligenes]|uniref:dTDP-4-dehydrorhamnose 3,5-epimerase n=1 Tax=Proteiniborus ethanoligenes TaxID=415015 RepID=A0A1H3K229_9FIRM|nr:dTDP-4-dehydrorhamnose 3,5-epimerase [Proteiniborus ethanoligenes]SDY45658.1 dTDP-4-dehydrorhamnose 3,5-epimerase [Proteiniborus ethanoligenes]
MAKFNIINTDIEGLYIIEPKVFIDNRGYFSEIYNEAEFKNIGIYKSFLQDNISYSKKGVLRGLHFQHKRPQGKLTRVVNGQVYDVAVDLRVGSKTYGKWYGIVLSENNKKMLYIPEGFAHGFYVLSDFAIFEYKCTDYYVPSDQQGIIWNDSELGIEWPIDTSTDIILSEQDKKWGTVKDFQKCI